MSKKPVHPTAKPFNRLVPVPPPKGFMEAQAAAEEEKKGPLPAQKKVMINTTAKKIPGQ